MSPDPAPHRGPLPVTFPARGPSQARPASSPRDLPQAQRGWGGVALSGFPRVPSIRSRVGGWGGPLTCLLAEPRDATRLRRLQAASRLLD